MKQPLYTALRGGRVSWVAYFKDVNPGGASWTISNRIVSISGLSTGLDFAGGWKSAAVTIEGAGEEPPAGIAEGSIVHIGIYDGEFSGGLTDVIWLWAGWISTAFVNQRYFKFEAAGVLSQIDKTTTLMEYEARPPRDIYNRWLQMATNYRAATAAAPALDPEHREQIRVAAPAKNAGDLPICCANSPAICYARKGTETSWSSFWTATSYVTKSHIDGSRWHAVPDVKIKAFMPPDFKELYTPGRQLQFTWIFAHDSSAHSKSAYPAGVVEYGYLSGMLLTNPTLSMLTAGVTISDGELHDLEAEYSTRKEARDAANRDKGGSFIHANPRKVRLRVETGPATVQPWTDSSASTLGISSLLPSEYTMSEPAAELPDAAAGVGVSFPVISFVNAVQFSMDLKFTPQQMDTLWRNIGVTSAANAGNRYQIQEYINYCTIEAQPWTEQRIKDAGFLGDYSIFETSNGPSSNINAQIVQTAKDYGDVYALPLTVHTVTAYEIADPVEFPGSFECTYCDAWGNNAPFNVSTSGKADKYSLDILQGGFYGPSKKLTGNYYKFSSMAAEEQPLLMGDRITGATLASTGKTGIAKPHFQGQITADDGTTTAFSWQVWECAGDTAHAVRDSDNNQHFVFFGAGSLVNMPAAIGLDRSSHYLDTSAVLIKQHARENIYKGAQIRQYKITASLAFITIDPGDLVVVSLPDIDNAVPHLAMITSKDASTGSGTINLVVALMDKTDNLTLSYFPNLQNVLNQI